MNYFSILYNILLFPVFFIFARLYRLVNTKFDKRERNSEIHLNKLKHFQKKSKRIWFHVASMGEFEQAKPIIEILKSNYNVEIVVTFFSPSGFENQKNYKYADGVFYLPLDTLVRSKNFIKRLEADLAVFVRYEIWHNYLTYLNIHSTPTVLVSATKPNSFWWRFPFLKSFYIHNLNLFSTIYTAGGEHTEHYRKLNLKSTVISLFDTRYDRILEKVDQFQRRNKKNQKKLTLVAGSTWQKDEELLVSLDKRAIQLIIVPHDPNTEHIQLSKTYFNDAFLFSEIGNNIENISNKTIIVDSIGKLLELYSIADIAYVGGAFGAGLHSVSEPAGYGIPIICGNNYENSIDAQNLKKYGSLFAISDEKELNQIIDKLSNKVYRKETGRISRQFINERAGSSSKIAKDIENLLNF